MRVGYILENEAVHRSYKMRMSSGIAVSSMRYPVQQFRRCASGERENRHAGRESIPCTNFFCHLSCNNFSFTATRASTQKYILIQSRAEVVKLIWREFGHRNRYVLQLQ